MNAEVYEKLAEYLDKLPAGFPATESGVEIRILQRLFTPEQAQLAVHLTLIAEQAGVIAYRAGMPVEKVAQQLEEMDKKGLVFSILHKSGVMKYRIQQFVVGFWEAQVNKLYPELVEDFEEYLETFVDLDIWQKMPQLRTIPVGESIDARADVMPYERAEALVRKQKTIVVNNCICRQEMRILGKGCDKPLESCLSFGQAAERSIRQNRGRAITRSEALEILHNAEKAGLVLQTSNAKKAIFICTCCGCCCGALRSIKLDPNPASRVSSPFTVRFNPLTCIQCGVCIERCQMDALYLVNDEVFHDTNRCIGCGLCISTCPTNSFSLQRKKKAEQPYVPGTLFETYVRLGRIRGTLGIGDLIILFIRTVMDRLRSSRL
jgi:electron transport complex protein RnfB